MQWERKLSTYRKIYLVRHGKIDMGNEKCYIGNIDLPLCEEGILQCRKLKKFFSDVHIEKVYLSPLKRCVQTADIILKCKDVEKVLVEEFREIDMGEWDGKTFRYIKKFSPEEFRKRGENLDTFVPEGGESFRQLQERVMPQIMHIIKNSTGNIMVITHAGVNRVILGSILSIPLCDIFKIKQNYACINELYWDSERRIWVKEKFCLNM
ncbi:histidine phosphatase family protein [Clostridium moutaii]|uniref:histidine phosphatase family protein n=1 Tax=Clostridium moutaii TaxID=3240932 RepID=UPI00350F3CB8